MRVLLFAVVVSAAAETPVLDFEYFQERVQPIFLRKRPGHARCVSCHVRRVPALVPLDPGALTWNGEQSKKNFEAWKIFVVPGSVEKSRLLQVPLAHQAGGNRFHPGGKHFASKEDPEWQTLAGWVRGEKTAHRGDLRVLQSNSAGDGIHVIDPATNAVVGEISDIEAPHGLVISPDGTRVYVTDEALETLDVVDARSFKVLGRIPLSGLPNNVDVSKDGRRVYVGIRQGSGALDIIDTASSKNVKSVAVKGPIHNVYVTPDGRYVVAGSIASSTISVVDRVTETLAWTLTMSAGIRPMAFTTNPDGSTKDIVVQLSNYHGLAIVDFATRREVRRFPLPDVPGQHKETEGLQGSPSHGLAITPDGKMLWATSKYYDSVVAYSLPEYRLLKVVPVGLHPDWLTIPADGKNLYVAVAGDDITAVVDLRTFAVVKKILVGAVPKRVVSGILR